MPLQDFLAGTALFAVMLVAVAAATALIVRRRLPHLDALARALAAVVIGTAVLIAVHLVPLMLGVLTRGTVLAAGALAVGLAALVRPVTDATHEPAPQAPPSSPPAWALAIATAAFAAIAALADLARWAGDELVGVDPLTFHLPNVARWIQTGSVWQIDQFVPLLAHGNYPHNGDVVLLSSVLPWHNDFAVRLPITFFLVTAAVAVYAVARELRAPAAASVLAAAVAVSLPVVGVATIPRALPDSLMWTAFACGVLFLLRHARTARRSDLVLAGVALGIACGTKWYGVSSVAVVIVVWAGARLLAERGRRARALGDGVLVSALTLAGIAVWLGRNWALSGNPVFPLKVAPLGITIFDAPPDVIREQVGFTIADYVGDPHILGQLAGEVVEGLGLIPIICALAIAAAAALARRRGPVPDARVLAVAAAAVLLALVYTITPATALGVKGDPSLAHANTRYAVPALLLAVAVAAWVAGRVPRVAALALQAALAVAALYGAYKGYELQGLRDVVLGGAGIAALAAAGVALWRLRERRALLVAATAVAALAVLAAGHRVEQRINDARYLGSDPAIDTLLQAAPAGKRIGLSADWTVAGLTPIWPSFGTRLGNDVEYVGHFVRGFLTPYDREADFRAAIARRRYDLLVVGRGFFPPQPTREQRWALDAGWRTIALSRRLRVLVAPAAG
jgi:hypothetical protein